MMKRSLTVMMLALIIFAGISLACSQSVTPKLEEVAMDAAANTAATLIPQQELEQQIGQAVEAAGQADELLATAQAVGDQMDTQNLESLMDNVQMNQDGTFTASITEAQLNMLIQQYVTASQNIDSQVEIQDLAITLTGGNLIMTGRITSPLPGDLRAVFYPTVANSTLQFEVVEASFGDLTMPSFLIGSIEAILNDALAQALNEAPQGVQFQSVIVQEGIMIISGTIS